MIPIRHIPLVVGNVAPKRSDRDLEALSIRPRFKADPATGRPTKEQEGYTLVFQGVKGFEQALKLPMEVQKKAAELKAALDAGFVVRISPVGFRARLYAMTNQQGQLLSGVSISASDFEITSKSQPEEDVFLDLE